ncbi:hypothetical protein CKA32_002175 [Geitlerinema sp. FC II]|nr:hypothetical protein CKA32_002175 [Geitlerinema sp. FC II]
MGQTIYRDPRHLQDAGDLMQPFTEMGFCRESFRTAIYKYIAKKY